MKSRTLHTDYLFGYTSEEWTEMFEAHLPKGDYNLEKKVALILWFDVYGTSEIGRAPDFFAPYLADRDEFTDPDENKLKKVLVKFGYPASLASSRAAISKTALHYKTDIKRGSHYGW